MIINILQQLVQSFLYLLCGNVCIFSVCFLHRFYCHFHLLYKLRKRVFFLLMASIRIPNTKYETSSSCISSSLFISYFVHLLILSTKYTLHYALSVFSFSLQQRRSFYRLVSFFKLRKQTLRVWFSFLCANIFICLYCDQKTCIERKKM